MPRIKLLKVPPQRFDFLTFEELSRLVDAVKDDAERRALFLVGGEAGKIPLASRLLGALNAHRHLRGELVFCQGDGESVHPVCDRGRAPARLEAGRAAPDRCACPSAHVLLASRDARSATKGDSGARRTLDAEHDASVHALGAERALRDAIALLDSGQPGGQRR